MKLCIRGSTLRGVFLRTDTGLSRTDLCPNWLYCQASSPDATGPGCETQRHPWFQHTNLSNLARHFILCCIRPVPQACHMLSFHNSFPGLEGLFLISTVKLLFNILFSSGIASGFPLLKVTMLFLNLALRTFLMELSKF